MQLSIHNFQCFDEHVVEFDHGVTTIVGESGSGKTTHLRAVSWCLFKRPNTGYIGSNKKSPTEVTFTWGSYSVYRRSSPAKLTLTTTNKVYEGKEAQSQIERICGSYDVWRSCCYLSQGDSNWFLNLSNNKRADVINALLHRTCDVAGIRKFVKSNKSACDVEIRANQKNLELWDHKLQRVQVTSIVDNPLDELTRVERCIPPLEDKIVELRAIEHQKRFIRNSMPDVRDVSVPLPDHILDKMQGIEWRGQIPSDTSKILEQHEMFEELSARYGGLESVIDKLAECSDELHTLSQFEERTLESLEREVRDINRQTTLYERKCELLDMDLSMEVPPFDHSDLATWSEYERIKDSYDLIEIRTIWKNAQDKLNLILQEQKYLELHEQIEMLEQEDLDLKHTLDSLQTELVHLKIIDLGDKEVADMFPYSNKELETSILSTDTCITCGLPVGTIKGIDVRFSVDNVRRCLEARKALEEKPLVLSKIRVCEQELSRITKLLQKVQTKLRAAQMEIEPLAAPGNKVDHRDLPILKRTVAKYAKRIPANLDAIIERKKVLDNLFMGQYGQPRPPMSVSAALTYLDKWRQVRKCRGELEELVDIEAPRSSRLSEQLQVMYKYGIRDTGMRMAQLRKQIDEYRQVIDVWVPKPEIPKEVCHLGIEAIPADFDYTIYKMYNRKQAMQAKLDEYPDTSELTSLFDKLQGYKDRVKLLKQNIEYLHYTTERNGFQEAIEIAKRRRKACLDIMEIIELIVQQTSDAFFESVIDQANCMAKSIFTYPVELSLSHKKSDNQISTANVSIKLKGRKASVSSLSGGELSRISLIVMIALSSWQPDLPLFLDESLDNIHTEGRNRIVQLLQDLGRTTIIISHADINTSTHHI